ncbi:MAG: caspase family protein [Candidatus Parabeggiatoa sp.]|nr:caspase family protein [Candidatus Parabeggiatoa sp.]
MNSKHLNFLAILSCVLLLSACFSSSSKPTGNTTVGGLQPTSKAENAGMFSRIFGSGSSPKTEGSGKIFTRRFHLASGRRDGGTLHALIVADTDDANIGESVKVDLKRMESLVEEIAQKTGLSLNGGSIAGDTFTKSSIMTAVNNLSVEQNDVVLFYNSSHGFNSGGSKWPDIHLENGSVPLVQIADILRNKNPRLSIIMADVCNKASNRGSFLRSRTGGKAKNYQELFLNSKGTIIASSSIEGQYSWGDPQRGGYFSNAFLGELDKELIVSNRRPSWKAIMERATQAIPLRPNPHQQKTQQPQAEVNVKAIGSWSQTDCSRTPDVPECIQTPGCRDCPSQKPIFQRKFGQ